MVPIKLKFPNKGFSLGNEIVFRRTGDVSGGQAMWPKQKAAVGVGRSHAVP